MKLYHGSPKKLDAIKPAQAKGLTKFENQKAIFLSISFDHAALYAIGKTLKGKTSFAVTQRRLIIVGNKKPISGYVYEVNVDAKKGERGQYSYDKQINDFKITKVNPKDYNKKTLHTKDKEELIKILNIKTK